MGDFGALDARAPCRCGDRTANARPQAPVVDGQLECGIGLRGAAGLDVRGLAIIVNFGVADLAGAVLTARAPSCAAPRPRSGSGSPPATSAFSDRTAWASNFGGRFHRGPAIAVENRWFGTIVRAAHRSRRRSCRDGRRRASRRTVIWDMVDMVAVSRSARTCRWQKRSTRMFWTVFPCRGNDRSGKSGARRRVSAIRC